MPVFRTRAGRRISIHLKEAQVHELQNHYAKNDEGEWIVEDIEVDRRGITLIERGRFRFKPYEWDTFWSAALGSAQDARLRGTEVDLILMVFGQWDLNRRADALMQDVHAGKAGLRNALENEPDLQDHPAIQREVMELYISGGLPKRRPGRPSNPDPGALELYAWANWYYVDNNISLEEACERAIETHPHHIPAKWQSAPAETLRRYFGRIDRLPGHTLKAYRNRTK